ncbi:hypothetical protein L1887_63108 [Cichorium endivia]|nr:hypothetical protein L1887_63108 [Cichorium endivia]
MRTEDFFGIFKEFLAAYKKVKLDNVRIGEQRALEAKRRAAAEERGARAAGGTRAQGGGVWDDSAVLETLLGSLRSGGGGPNKQRRKARERRQTNAASNAGGSEDSTLGSGPGVAGEKGNPSDVAAAMLAKLQGGEEGSEVATSSAFRPTRRRDRRSGRDAPLPPGSAGLEQGSPAMSSPSLSQTASSSTHTPSASISASTTVRADASADTTIVPPPLAADAKEEKDKEGEEEEGAAEFEDALPAHAPGGGGELEWFDPDTSGFSAAGKSSASHEAEQ